MNTPPLILVIEDSQLLREVLKDALTAAKLNVVEAKDGKEGLELALKLHPDLIMLDLIMPIMDGLTMFRLLRQDEWGKHVPVLMLSAANEKIVTWVDNEELEYLTKGTWAMTDVVTRVKSLLGVE